MSAVGVAYSAELEFEHAAENRKKFVRFAIKFGRLSLEDAEDIVQDAFLKAFKNISGFRRESQMDTWITSIVVREILMLMRSAKRRTDHSLVSSLDDPIYFAVRDRLTADGFSPERTAIGKEALEQVLEAIYELKTDQRDALLTRCDLTRTIYESAALLGYKRTKLQAHICRGRVALRKKLQIV